MTHNSLSPGFVRLRYLGSSLTHIQTIPVIPVGVPVIGDEPDFATKSTVNKTMSECIDAYVNVFKAVMGPTVTIVDAEFWYQATPEDDPYWVFTYPIGVVGTSGTASVPERQSVISYRTGQGGLAFHYMMEVNGSIAGSQRQNFPTNSTAVNAVNAFLVGTDSFFVGRDGAFFITPVWWTTKNNDAIRKKVLNL